MKKYYAKLMENNATQYSDSIENSKGQKIEFYEHPFKGDMAPVIAVCHELKVAADTDFFDTEDFCEDSDYNPVFLENEMVCEFDL